MLRICIRFFLCVLIPVPLLSAAQTTPVEPETTLRTSTELVVIDVTAIDSQQKPVTHLEAPDFSILEDGHPQTIKVFEEHVASASAPLPPAPKLDPGTFTNAFLVPANGALDILLFDKLNTPMDAQAQLRDQVLKYLKEAPAGTRMAIFTLTTQAEVAPGIHIGSRTIARSGRGQEGERRRFAVHDRRRGGRPADKSRDGRVRWEQPRHAGRGGFDGEIWRTVRT